MNKNNIKIVILFFASIAISVFICVYFINHNQHSKHLTLGLINIQRVRSQGAPFKKLQLEVEKEQAINHDKILKLEENLRKEYTKLQSENFQSSEDINKKKIEIDKKVATLEQEVQDARNRIKQKFQNKMEEIELKLETIIRQYAKDNNIDLLLNTNANDYEIALVANENLNHTDAIIKILNK